VVAEGGFDSDVFMKLGRVLVKQEGSVGLDAGWN
jgi:hypothetical protein